MSVLASPPAANPGASEGPRKLKLSVRGRVLEQLGLQIYQSPVNSIAELVANCWDADAALVEVNLPTSREESSEIQIVDNGNGMSFAECQEHYLQVGLNRRGSDPTRRTRGGRAVLGRKGIGKFAGFGIASRIVVSTISIDNGEMTKFHLKYDDIVGEEYVITEGKEVEVLEYAGPDEGRKERHGTTITLTGLTFQRLASTQSFAKSLARRFLLHQQQAGFIIKVNNESLPDGFDLQGVQFVFPRDYDPEEKYAGLATTGDRGWGEESLSDGRKIRWRFILQKETLDEDELRGIAVYSNGKLVQTPFLFNLVGGLGGQHGVAYLTGQVEDNHLDSVKDDLVATERQRVNWEHPEAVPLLEWGKDKVKEILRIWKDRRGAEKHRILEERVSGFAERLARLGKGEAKTVKTALLKIAQISSISSENFVELGSAILSAWEGGRLKALITSIAEEEDLEADRLLEMLVEAQVLTALNVAEAVKTKLLVVAGLKQRLDQGALEDEVRTYVEQNPWLISPKWETFQREITVPRLVAEARGEAGLTIAKQWPGRVDLVLKSGEHLLLLEFMRPEITLDREHLDRFERYMDKIRVALNANTGGPFRRASGYVVADGIARHSDIIEKIQRMKESEMLVMDWSTLFSSALAQWGEMLDLLIDRTPGDPRLAGLRALVRRN